MRDQYDMEFWAAHRAAFNRDMERMWAALLQPFKVLVRREYDSPWRQCSSVKTCRG